MQYLSPQPLDGGGLTLPSRHQGNLTILSPLYPGLPTLAADGQTIEGERTIVVGAARPPGSDFLACMWDDGAPTLLPTPPGRGDARAVAVNRRGDVIGWARARGNGDLVRGVVWRCDLARPVVSEALELIPTGHNTCTEPRCINRLGLIVGSSYAPDARSRRTPTMWFEADAPIRLPLPDGFVSGEALSVNDTCEIVGWGQTADGKLAPLAWSEQQCRLLSEPNAVRFARLITNSKMAIGLQLGAPQRVVTWNLTCSSHDFAPCEMVGPDPRDSQRVVSLVRGKGARPSLVINSAHTLSGKHHHGSMYIKPGESGGLDHSTALDLNEIAATAIRGGAYKIETAALLQNERPVINFIDSHGRNCSAILPALPHEGVARRK